jgi:hypothetical protein
MPLTCNIDARGKLARLIWGVVMILLALAAAFWAWRVGGTWRWVVTVVLLGMGAFSVFEARAGWCVVRAMGFKTKW